MSIFLNFIYWKDEFFFFLNSMWHKSIGLEFKIYIFIKSMWKGSIILFSYFHVVSLLSSFYNMTLCVMNLQCNKLIYCCDCDNIHKGKHIFVEWSPIRWVFKICDEFPFGCNPHKDQTLGTWMILVHLSRDFLLNSLGS
jgi:hypothetical protein